MWVNIPFGYSFNDCYIFLLSFFLVCTEISKSWSPIWTWCCRGPCKISLVDFQVSLILCKTISLLSFCCLLQPHPWWLLLCKLSHTWGRSSTWGKICMSRSAGKSNLSADDLLSRLEESNSKWPKASLQVLHRLWSEHGTLVCTQQEVQAMLSINQVCLGH